MKNSQEETQAKPKPSVLLEVALEEEDEKDRDETSWAETLEIFVESGKSEIEHHAWREKKLGPLLIAWLQLVDSVLNQNPRSLGTVALANECGEDEQYEHLEFSPIRASRTQIEVDIAKWYLRNLESNNFTYPGCENDLMPELGSEVACLLRTFGTQTRLAAAIDIKAIITEESKAPEFKIIDNTKEDTIRKNYMKLSCDDLEENQDLAGADIVKHKFPDLCKDETASNQPDKKKVKDLAKNLTDQASRARKGFKKINEDKLELPIRLYTARGGIWEQYALTYAGRPGKGNKYGIIKTDLTTNQS